MNIKLPLYLVSVILLLSCSPSRQLAVSAKKNVIDDPVLRSAHVGISVFEPASGKWWYSYQGDKYFVPASNTKLPTCYAAMKYLGDSLVGIRYERTESGINIIPTGDPTFLHSDFKRQPVFELLKTAGNVFFPLDGSMPQFAPMGNGWAWNDYLGDYAAERSEMPIYGNVAHFFMRGDTTAVLPSFFYNSSLQYHNGVLRNDVGLWFTMVRSFENNNFHALNSTAMYRSKTKFTTQDVPFKTIPHADSPLHQPLVMKLLGDTLHKKVDYWAYTHARPRLQGVVYSQPTDSLLKPMMHRSDNFFAEQSLLMVSDRVLGYMSDEKIIDTLLKTDFKDLPQRPRWVDGSGLSRYNLFTPQDLVTILNKMRTDFGMERIKEILPTGNEGTLTNYYKNEQGTFFGKTGTLSGVVALSGFLYTKKNRLLIVSVLVNNHQASAPAVRRAVEKFVESLREQY